MRKPEYSEFISNLSNVKTLKDIFEKTFEVFSIFFKDPLFLTLMTLGYALIILTYFIHSGRVWKIKGFKNKIAACGFPLSNGKHIALHYGLGFLFGFLMMTCTVGIMCLTGQISFNGFTLNTSGMSVFFFNLLMSTSEHP